MSIGREWGGWPMRLSRIIVGALLAAALTIPAGCGSTTTSGDKEMRANVRGDITQVMSDIATAEKADPAIATHSDPFTYAELSPALDRLVARGEPALESIAEEIESSPENGLREYLLAMAGQDILGAEKIKGAWSTGKEWASYYRANK
jgi:hypothetical protein